MFFRLQRRSKLKNEANSLKIKRKSSTEKDVGSLRQKDYDHDDIDDVDKVDYSDDDNAGDTEKHDKKHSHCRVTHGFHLVEGKMNHRMEDYVVAENRRANGYKLGLYAIFDGHSGCSVAEYLQSHLFDRILNKPDFWTQPKAAIRRAYRDTDNEILEKVVGSRGGSTAVTAILINQEKLIVANVGDSRAVICRSGSAKQITVDHDPQKEKKLIESRGGFVSQKPGNIPRVDGQLAMTRAFGDERLKEHITAEPDIVLVTIDTDTEFIILASDGLWKVMSNQEAADCIIDLADAQEASEKLIREALARNSRDDISCIVVMFQ
ncbi:probable protein phosphatase 2C 62 isoform X2 [Diospyros lotus]|uniref:probable protein phosphatase 2C 62 isoform X2 n=1 Tax=Diospyros lotus TaxID=55363 RepID=UPI0022553ABB|nr:probable protein phosphatase 2C 62 isoform X2 [Diospyros lotus]XP_052183485.1 probable protein phosphatase 2C 62 isoform X2 [Diospyros lotus]XP_052183486.1 probable protein phosphatase 2C 62 isoform X2 [Diospyros lotus]XP_052183487.1 probable protein phosphatase 2C 62 isoform X2 [Diospyros lotus]XP_052183488.1 probable protein phosphatase 2C 62 isoform X2 [Diospyros lotus]